MDEAFHDDLAGERAGDGGVLAGGEQSDGEEGAGAGRAQERAEELVGVLDGGDFEVAAAMEDGGGDDQDGRIDEEGEGEREGGIDVGHADGFALAFGRALVVAALHDGRVQVEIVGHDRGAEDADGDVEHSGLVTMEGDGTRGCEGRAVVGAREEDWMPNRRDDGADERDDQRFDIAEAPALQEQDEEDVEAGDEDAVEERDVEEQVERDGGADDFGQVAGGDGDLGDDPEGRS